MSSPRYEVVSFRTTKEQREILNQARGSYTISAFIDLLLTLYLQGHEHGHSNVGTICEGQGEASRVCAA
jgi:hypothetical protein